ncbi:MAG: LegC family aminotransferase [Oscillospiraceae bacterium]
MSDAFVPLSVPNFGGNEQRYVNDAVVSEWVSSGGSKVAEFEAAVARYTGMAEAVACASGTAGLHLAMLVAGIGCGDEVIAPALTFIAAVNPIRYAGAQPVFIGCDDTLCIDAAAVEAFCRDRCERQGGKLINKTSGRHVKAIEVVHVFGNLADMDAIMRTAHRYGLIVVEDATEAMGCFFGPGPGQGPHAGTVGDVGVFSFNGNKIITTGSGGMLVSRHAEWTRHAKHLSTQAKTDEIYYTHDEVGYNYRLTNLAAALGLAQMEQLEGFVARKQAAYQRYKEQLDGRGGLRLLPFREDIRANHWFFSLYLESAPLGRDELLQRLQADGIQTRTIWGLIPQQAPYAQNEAYALEKAQDYHARVLNIPCSTGITDAEIDRVCARILAHVGG